MRCLTVKEPFASLIMSGEKRIENRSWGLNVRGEIAIHAALPKGEILGTVQVLDVLLPAEAQLKYPDQAQFISGPLCWVLAANKSFVVPIKCSGRLSLWIYEEKIMPRTHQHGLTPTEKSLSLPMTDAFPGIKIERVK